MSRLVAFIAAAACIVALVPHVHARGPAPERVMVRGSEFDLLLSKSKLRPGPVIVQFLNAGEDPHDLRIERRGEDGEFGVGRVEPGAYENLEARLRRSSTYVLWCSLSDHRERGMEASLRTRKRRG